MLPEYPILANIAPKTPIHKVSGLKKYKATHEKEPRVVNALVTAHLNDNYGKVGSEYLHNIR